MPAAAPGPAEGREAALTGAVRRPHAPVPRERGRIAQCGVRHAEATRAAGPAGLARAPAAQVNR